MRERASDKRINNARRQDTKRRSLLCKSNNFLTVRRTSLNNIIDPISSPRREEVCRAVVVATGRHTSLRLNSNESIFEDENALERAFLTLPSYIISFGNQEDSTYARLVSRNPHEETELPRRSFDRPLFIGHVLIDDEHSVSSTVTVGGQSSAQPNRSYGRGSRGKKKCRKTSSKETFESRREVKEHKSVSYARSADAQ